MTESELLKIKALLTPGVLKIPGVAGLGVGKDGLNVYLEQENEETRHRVERAVKEVATTLPLNFILSGGFRADLNPENLAKE